MSDRQTTSVGSLARTGFVDPERAQRSLDHLAQIHFFDEPLVVEIAEQV